ncbi:uncharacterized protein LOC130623257 [Hydractinia symbiolongicarpus]|uniref:uncharacterized protein LOC130623257 n=1 Tax=Hydractinia symbiolongicarpus TaxID=13093 RepID=UPI00254E3115|nr:uncharacterized protein LOC130623257 [Hydractinia symbiolongicarpus]
MVKFAPLHYQHKLLCRILPMSFTHKESYSILKSAKISVHLLLRHSKNPILSALNATVKAGTWRANEAVDTVATYDVLPSPNNLKRWKIITESSCFLCHKEICTSAHILGACKIALVQGSYTFRHDSVLVHLVDTLKQFLSTLPLTISRKCNSMTFVKAGAYVSPKSKTKVTGILYLTNDWIVVADTSPNFVFPGHIAVTQLRPDIVIFSNKLNRVVIIELTCPCEENANYWHSTKVTKYSCLVNVILSSGWQVDFFAVEVGAKGYCARTTTACLKRLGFSNKMAYSIAKYLGKISMTASFCVWIARGQETGLKTP